jgi:hypothetical protein
MQVESLCQHIKRIAHYLLWVLPKLPIKIRIVMRSHAAFESFSVSGSIEEPCHNTQCFNAITGRPRATDLVAFAVHVIGLSNALARPCEKLQRKML